MIVGVDPSPLGETDAGDGREERAAHRAAFCLERMPGARYCTRDRGHEGEHASHAPARELPVNTFGPEQAAKRGWGR